MKRNLSRILCLVYPPTLILFLVLISASNSLCAINLLTTYHGENLGDQYGISICNAGDINRDGYEDLLIGANLEDTGGDAAGKCYLYFGGPGIDTIPDLTIIGSAGESFGSTVCGNGDINGDGFSDFAVYAIGDSSSPGKVYVYLGGFQPDGIEYMSLSGLNPGDRFGYSMAMSGDINGDGFNDLIVGAPGADSTGAVYIYLGGSEPDGIPDAVLRGEGAGDFFGCSVSSAGDLNGDGYSDILIGARLNSQASFWAGKAYVFFGGASIDTIPDLEISGEAIGDGFGSAVMICPDINGDSCNDFVISSPYFNTSQGSDVGKAYIFLGGPLLDAVADAEITGEYQQNLFGYAIGAVDENADGLSDIIVGAPNYGGSSVQMGKVYLYYGEFPFDQACDFSDTGSDSLAGLGFSIAGFKGFNYYSGEEEEFAAGAWNANSKGAVKIYGEPLAPTGADESASGNPFGFHASIYPNPSSGSIRMRMFLQRGANVSAGLYDVTGRKVADIFSSHLGEGETTIQWRRSTLSRNIADGVYFIRLKYGEKEITRKVLILQ